MNTKQNDPLYLRKGLWAVAAAYREIEDTSAVDLMVKCAQCLGIISAAGLSAPDPPDSVVKENWKSYLQYLSTIKETASQWAAVDGQKTFPYARIPSMKADSAEGKLFKACCQLAYKCFECQQSIVQAAREYGIATKPPKFPSEFTEEALTSFYKQLMGFMPDGAYSVSRAGCMNGIYVPDGKDTKGNPKFKLHQGGNEAAGHIYHLKMQGRMWTIAGGDGVVRYENRQPARKPPSQGWKPSNHPEAKGKPFVQLLQAGGSRSNW